MAYFRKRGDVWAHRINYNDLGKQKTLSKSGFATKSAARAAVLVEEKLFEGIDEFRKGDILFEDWLKKFKLIYESQQRST